MTKQMRMAMASMLLLSAINMQAQLTTTTKTIKVAPGETKTTVITKEKGATSGGTHTVGKKKRTPRKSAPAKKEAAESTISRELREMREKQAAQQAQIDSLTQSSAAKDAALARAQQAAATAEAQAQAATAQQTTMQTTIQTNTEQVTALKSNLSDMQTINAGLASTISANKTELQEKIDSPTTIHYKGVTITPVAFFALEGVWRQRSVNSDINTPFNTIPFMGSNEAHLSEFNFSGRQSRLGGLIEGNAGPYKLSGYFETDFLSSGTTSNNNQSNSYTLRQRQIWGKAETSRGFAVTGGQMWSLVTENVKSTDVRTEKLPNTVDPQYMVGYSWARQPAIRIQQKFASPMMGNSLTLAMSVEQAQTQFVGTGYPNNFIFGGTGVSGGLYNAFNGTYTNNVAPDVLVKMAFDTKISHVEFGGIARFFRDEYYPLVLNAAGVTTSYSPNLQKNTKLGGGAFGAARVTLNKFVDVAIQGMGGDGVGRYGSAQLGDVTAHPDGTLEPLRNYHGEFSLETHPTKKLDLYAYYGAEYEQRTYYTSNSGTFVGYGAPNLNDTGCAALTTAPVLGTGTGGGTTGVPGTVGSCASPTRAIQQGMVGFTYRVVNSPKYGRLQYQATYSYLTRSLWTGLASGTLGSPSAVFGGPKAVDNMVHVGMRYYIP